MPRKHKSDKHRSKSDRRSRKSANKARMRSLVGTGQPGHHKIDLDPFEFGNLFKVIGGREAFARECETEQAPVVKAFDVDRNPAGRPVVDKVLVISDKHAELMQNADDAAARREARENHREEAKQKRVSRLIAANERGSIAWFRQEVPDQNMRSILTGSNNGKDPMYESDSLVICFKGSDGRYHAGAEKWSGDWTLPNSEGFRYRVGVEFDPLPHTYHSESEAHESILMAIRIGAFSAEDEVNPVFVGNKDATHLRRFAARLRVWMRANYDENGNSIGTADMKTVFAKPKPAKKQEGKGRQKRILA